MLCLQAGGGGGRNKYATLVIAIAIQIGAVNVWQAIEHAEYAHTNHSLALSVALLHVGGVQHSVLRALS